MQGLRESFNGLVKGDRCIQRTGKVDINFSEINKNRSQDKD